MSDTKVEEETQLVTQPQAGILMRGYANWTSFFIGSVCCGLSVTMVWSLSSKDLYYQRGPMWLMSLVCLFPFLFGMMYNIRSFTHICLGPLLCLGGIWALTHDTRSNHLGGLPLAIGCWILISGCLFLWVLALQAKVSTSLVARLVCLLMTTAFVETMVQGIAKSISLPFHNVPFLLQPISIFGFASLEAWVFYLNALIAFIAYQMVAPATRSSLLRLNLRNPILHLVIAVSAWCIFSGILWGTSGSQVSHLSVGLINEDGLWEQMNRVRFTHGRSPDDVLGVAIREVLLEQESIPDIIVFHDQLLNAYRTDCEQQIKDHVAPYTRNIETL